MPIRTRGRVPGAVKMSAGVLQFLRANGCASILPNPTRSTSRSQSEHKHGQASGIGRAIGLGLITGAADDDPSAIGTYATAGARIGPSFLWTAPITFPMMVAVVYLSSKLGQVTGKGLFDVIRDHYPRWVLRSALIGVIIGNTIEAGADIGGMAAAWVCLRPGCRCR